ncbi:MAG TPA: transcriptional repressor [Thermoleophilaceae bacterium]|jgi:Fur family ferric uptake transcriptional regulator
MTEPHHAAPVAAPRLEDGIAAVRDHGLRLTSARRLLLEVLYATDEPLSAERIAGGLDGRLPSSDLASVYANLETLERIGLVRHFHAGHGAGLYVRGGGGPREYLACESCGAVRAVEPGELDGARREIRRRFGYEARFSHFPIVGLCERCAGNGGA